MSRNYSFLDLFLAELQNALTTVFAQPVHTERENPSTATQETELSAVEIRQSAGFMRVNHTGEVCAQALYRGQALCARHSPVIEFLSQAVDEEQDHLVWCHQRLNELQAKRSVLNFYWYTHSFFLGWLAGRMGDGWSLGFVEETEFQVSRHLQKHMKNLSAEDEKSRAIILQMDIDEKKHAEKAKELGANELPAWVKGLMSVHSKVMTTLAYWV
jgi:ubiquinone biosynthesis monooxygenase Coq7